ncbi:MAG: cysteine desulfurase-like protein [Longimicrobiales bacterium]|nr:cysteine desulfurase-like protein [Longimicrobiales bacterium]
MAGSFATTLVAPHVSSVEEVRAAFPALERVHAGHPVAYFDGPGGTQVPKSVVDAVADHLLHHNGNRNWGYPTSVETDDAVAVAREAMADLLGCNPGDVAFGPNMTTLTYHLSRTLGRRFGSGDEIIVTRLDHFANVSPWKALEQERGVVVREVPFHPEDGTLDTDAYEALLSNRTRLVALGWASNALGTVTNLVPLLEQAKAVGALTFVDGVHSVTHLLPAARALGCDFLACSPYKFYGPHAGVLYTRAELMDELDPPRLSCAPQTAPERFETGTQAHEDMPGITAAVDFLAGLAEGRTRRERLGRAYDALHARGDELIGRMWRGLASIPGVRLFGPPPGTPRTPTLSFVVEGHHSRSVAEHLWSRHGLFLSSGAFYAAYVPGDLGLSGPLVRAGCMAYTTEEEVDRLLEGVEELVAR